MSSAAPATEQGELEPVPPSILQIFLSFSQMALFGFGGLLPWIRWMAVEKRRWLTPDEFNEAMALAQFLPGANVLNLSVAIGARFRGAPGSLAAIGGLFGAPLILMTGFGYLYFTFGDIPQIQNTLAGVAVAAAGLIAAVWAKMAQPLVRNRAPIPLLVVATAFVAIAILKLPLLAVIAVLGPLSVLVSWWRHQ